MEYIILNSHQFYHLAIMFIVEFEILSMSKHIMHCVFDCANDCNVNIYYQDTGRIHINHDDVGKNVKIYRGTYNLDLVGENLIQFHVDFPNKKWV